MNRLPLILLLLLPLFTRAATDSLAPATHVHTKVELPVPHLTGEIIAEFSNNREEALLSFRKLSIKIGSRAIDVPKPILDFFIGVQPGSLQFLIGPPSEPALKEPDYFCVWFRYITRSYEGIESPTNHLIGCIYVKDGALAGLAQMERRLDGGWNAQFYDTELKAVPSLP